MLDMTYTMSRKVVGLKYTENYKTRMEMKRGETGFRRLPGPVLFKVPPRALLQTFIFPVKFRKVSTRDDFTGQPSGRCEPIQYNTGRSPRRK
jgi:hypothetical protein